MDKYILLRYKEFGMLDSPSVPELFSGKSYIGRKAIAEYLKNGTTQGIAAGVSIDTVTGIQIFAKKITDR